MGVTIRAAIGVFAAIMPLMSAAAQPTAGARYVSMGSSYAAGPGIGAPDRASRGCARSLSNYARRVARRFRFDLVDVACSGATTRDILNRSQYGFPPQIEAVDARTKLVTVTIGGNDVNYVGDLFGHTCVDAGGTGCAVTPDAKVDQLFAALPAALREVVAQVRRRAPGATLMLVGYLPVIPANGPDTCPAVPLGPGDAARMRAVAARLARAIDGVAADAHVPVVPAWKIGVGHEACSAAPFVAGYRPGTTPGWPGPVPYHPNQAGMDQLAAAIDALLAGNTAAR